MTEMSDLLEIKTALAELRGEMRTMAAEIRSGDRDAASSVKLLAQTVEYLSQMQKDQREDLKQALGEFRVAIDTLRDTINVQTDGVSLRLERRIEAHEIDDAPHAKSLGSRLDAVESKINRAIGATTLLGILGAGNVITLWVQGH